jgi:hypothetical protein
LHTLSCFLLCLGRLTPFDVAADTSARKVGGRGFYLWTSPVVSNRAFSFFIDFLIGVRFDNVLCEMLRNVGVGEEMGAG